jgi:hypothetical protein
MTMTALTVRIIFLNISSRYSVKFVHFPQIHKLLLCARMHTCTDSDVSKLFTHVFCTNILIHTKKYSNIKNIPYFI